VDEALIDDGDDLVRTISALRPGTDVALWLLRDGRAVRASAVLEERTEESGPEPRWARPIAAPGNDGDALGLVVDDLEARARNRVPADHVGVVIRSILGADPGTDLLEEGDLVVEINRRATPDMRAYQEVLGSLPPGQSAWLYVYRPDPPGSFLTRVEVEENR
jgi:S1-C subfamily serine protease